jgi:hypothetical protein
MIWNSNSAPRGSIWTYPSSSRLLTDEVSIPQTHLVGAEAEVDFGEFYATIAGLVVKCWIFVMRLSHSGDYLV